MSWVWLAFHLGVWRVVRVSLPGSVVGNQLEPPMPYTLAPMAPSSWTAMGGGTSMMW